MNSIYILSNSEDIISSIKESLSPLSELRIEGITSLKLGLDIINSMAPDILILGGDLSFDEIERVSREIRGNKRVENIPIVFSMNNPDASKIDLLFKGKLVDDCLILRSTIPEKRFRIEKLIELKKLREELEKYKSEALYLQSEIATYERKRYYLDRKSNKENKEALINLMHKIRTYLTGIKGGVEILLNNKLSEKENEDIVALIRRNISELEEFINSEDLTTREEKKSLQPTVIQFKGIFDDVAKRAQLEARKNSISLFLKPLDKDYSVLANAEDLEFGLESILKGLIYSAKTGSIIRGEVKPQNAGNLLEISLKIKKDSLVREKFEEYIELHNEALKFLPQQNNKLEISEDFNNLTIRLYLLRLS